QGPVEIVGNTVSGVVATAGSTSSSYGIYTEGELDSRIVGNSVRGLVKDGAGTSSFGIYNYSSGSLALHDNDVFGDGTATGSGLRCGTANGHARDNQIA